MLLKTPRVSFNICYNNSWSKSPCISLVFIYLFNLLRPGVHLRGDHILGNITIVVNSAILRPAFICTS